MREIGLNTKDYNVKKSIVKRKNSTLVKSGILTTYGDHLSNR